MNRASDSQNPPRLRLALLGGTPAAAAAAIAEQAGVELLLVADDSGSVAGSGAADMLPPELRASRRLDNWEELLSGSLVDAVVLGAGPAELRCEQLRRLQRRVIPPAHGRQRDLHPVPGACDFARQVIRRTCPSTRSAPCIGRKACFTTASKLYATSASAYPSPAACG